MKSAFRSIVKTLIIKKQRLNDVRDYTVSAYIKNTV